MKTLRFLHFALALLLLCTARAADVQISDFTATTSPASTDLLHMQIDVSGTWRDRKITLGNFKTSLGLPTSDPNADRLLFWDDSAGGLTYLTLGTGLSITGTTINASEAGATTRVVYVATDGSDSADGSLATPLATLTAALAAIDGNGDIVMQAGDYTGLKLSLATAENVTIRSAPAATVNVYLGEKPVTWTLDTGSTYVATITTVIPADNDNKYWVFEKDTAEREILTAERHPLQRNRTYALAHLRLPMAADLATCRATAGTYFFTGTSLYVHRSDGLAPNDTTRAIWVPSQTALQSFVHSGTAKTTIRIEGINVFFGEDNFDFSEVGRFEMVSCLSYGAGNEGLWADDFRFGRTSFCEFAAAANDGVGTQRTDAPSVQRISESDWSHDNGDEGHSEHYGAEAVIQGGLIEYNRHSGASEYTQDARPGSKLTFHGTITRRNSAGVSIYGAGTMFHASDWLSDTDGEALWSVTGEFSSVVRNSQIKDPVNWAFHVQAAGDEIHVYDTPITTGSVQAAGGGTVTFFAGSTKEVTIRGSTSGYATIKAPAVAGTAEITLPGVTSTLATLGANTFAANQTVNGYVIAGAGFYATSGQAHGWVGGPLMINNGNTSLSMFLNNGTTPLPLTVGAITATSFSGSGASLTGIPVSGITASTSTALGVGSVELGHATDTTLSRVSAGVASIEGVNILTQTGTQTGITNKTFVAPVLGAATATSINGNFLTAGSSTYTGTAGQTYTFPTTTATIARSDAAQTFSGNQTFAQITIVNNRGAWYDSAFLQPSGGVYSWSNSSTNCFATADTSIWRSAAGEISVAVGTGSGSGGNLKANNITAGGTTTLGTGGTAIASLLSAVKSAFDCPSIAANGGVQTTTLSLTGATTASVAKVSIPSGGLDDGVLVDAYVSASNTVTIKFTNATAGAIDPASASYRVTVINF